MAQAVTAITRDAQVEAARVPPQSIEAEQSVLGGLLLDNASWDRVADIVTENDFYRADHRAIFRHIARLQRFQVKPDRCDRSLEFMRDGVDEAVVLFAAANFANEEDRVEHEAGDVVRIRRARRARWKHDAVVVHRPRGATRPVVGIAPIAIDGITAGPRTDGGGGG